MAAPSSNLNVLVFAASVREGSLNEKLARLAARAAENVGVVVDHASMRDFDVPRYEGDVEAASGIPRGAEAMKQRLLASDAFIIACPEYDASMPLPSTTRPGVGADRVDPVPQ